LLDEIEKAHPDVFNTLLQVLDDGRLTDNQGKTVNFTNCVVIMTSNVGAMHLLDGVGRDGEITESARKKVMSDLKSMFRPEFLNRVDDVVLFSPLKKDQIKSIVELMMKDLRQRLTERSITIAVDEEAKAWIADQAYDPVYGARPLRRFLQRELETKIGRAMIAGKIADGSEIKISVRNEELQIN